MSEQWKSKMSGKPRVTKLGVLKRIVTFESQHISGRSKHCCPALHQAVQTGSVMLVRLLLWRGVEVNAVDCCKRTALHLACHSRHKSNQIILELLLNKGAEVDVQNEWGETPLHVACWSRNNNLVGVLLNNGAKSDVANYKGMTPLQVVARLKVDDTSLVDAILESNDSVNAVNSQGWSSLHFACLFKRTDTVAAIINKGGDVNLADSEGNTPLHIACTKTSTDIIDILLSTGARVNARNNDGRTAIHLASSHFLTKVLDVLVENGAEVNSQDSSGNTPLHLVISGESKYFYDNVSARADTVELLLMKGAKVDVINVSLKTPFEELVCYVKQFCCEENRTSHDIQEVKRLKDMLLQHIVKLKTAGIQVAVDISTELYDEAISNCWEELTTIKSITVVNGLSLYEVFAKIDKPYFMSHDEILAFDGYLNAPDLLKRFPLYGYLLMNTFRRSKLLTHKLQRQDKEANDVANSELLSRSSPSETYMEIFFESEEETTEVQKENRPSQVSKVVQPCYKEANNEEESKFCYVHNLGEDNLVTLSETEEVDERVQEENITCQGTKVVIQVVQPCEKEADAEATSELCGRSSPSIKHMETLFETEEETTDVQEENESPQESKEVQLCYKEANNEEEPTFCHAHLLGENNLVTPRDIEEVNERFQEENITYQGTKVVIQVVQSCEKESNNDQTSKLDDRTSSKIDNTEVFVGIEKQGEGV